MPIGKDEFDAENVTARPGRSGNGLSAKIVELLSDLQGYSRDEIAEKMEIDTEDKGPNHSLTSNLSVLLHGKKITRKVDGEVEKYKTEPQIVTTSEKGVTHYWSIKKLEEKKTPKKTAKK